ncbi:13488_t:CDS:2 [Entrophospora sp. SA101]|nr:13488_t:CDS:2 [Entrophospora sp. SA101]
MDQIKEYSSKAEDILEAISQPFKPHIPAIARFLIVATFLEDALRILFQWSSFLIIKRKYLEYAVLSLFLVILSQSIGYGLFFELNFFLRSLSVTGGLLMVLSDAFSKRKSVFADLPQLSERDRKTYFQLAGLLFLSVFNVLINNFWSVHHADPQRDFLKYDFFQTLSIVGGLLLLVSMGPGGISIDEKKKAY